MTKKNTKIIAFVGLAGSGKKSAVTYLSENGFPRIHVGGFIIQGLKDQNIEINPENERIYREKMRSEHGQDVFMKMAIQQIQRLDDAGQHNVVLHGLYSWSEYRLLKHEFPGELTVIAIVTPKALRKQRMAKRAHRPLTPEQVDKRDWSEIEYIEKGGPIAVADYFVQNNGSIEQLHQQIDTILIELGIHL